MRLFRRRSAGNGGPVPDRAGADRSGGMSGGLWDTPTSVNWDAYDKNSSTQSSLSANREQNSSERTLAESRTFAGRRHPQDQARLDNAAAARTKASETAAMREEGAARAKKVRETGGGMSGYNPYADSDTGHI